MDPLTALRIIFAVASGVASYKSYKKAKKLEKQANQLLLQKYGTGGGIPVAYGTRKVAGTVLYANTINNRELFVVYALAIGEVEDISNIKIGGRSVADTSVYDHYIKRTSNYYGSTQQEIDNILDNQDPPNKPRMVFNCHLGGADQVADPMLVGCIPEWTSAHRLRGIAYIAANFDYDSGKGMFAGFPEITCDVQGKKIYDPRKDSTVTNGSGSHRIDDPSTFEFSDNSALVLLDYLTNTEYGKALPTSAIDMQSFMDSANKNTVQQTLNYTATIERLSDDDTFRLAKTSANKTVYNALKVGNPITIKIGETTYAEGTVVGKISNSRADSYEDDYRDANAGYEELRENLYIIQLSAGAVTTTIGFTETPASISITTTQDRFPFNGVVDTEETLFDNTKKILGNMRGIFNYLNGVYSLKIEDAESVALSIDDDDILESGITVSIENKEEKYNIVEVEFANAQRGYELDTITYKHTSETEGEDYTYDDGGEELKLTYEMPYITNANIAYQNAKAVLLRSRNSKSISFTGTHKLLYVKVGELISVTNSALGMSSEQYRITKMSINHDLTVNVEAIIYQSNIYGYVTPPTENIDIPDDLVDSFKVDTPTNVNFVDKDPTTAVQPYLEWDNPTTYPAYEFRVVVKDSSNNVKYDGRTKNTFFNLTGIEVDTGYTAEVFSMNTNYVESQPATYNFNNSVPPVQTGDLGDSSVTDEKVADISADKIDTGVLNLGTESGMAVRQAKTGYTDTTTGFWLGNDSGTPKFNIGTSSNYFKFDGSSVNISGDLTATSLNVTDATITGTLDASVITLDGDPLDDLFGVSGTGSAKTLSVGADIKNQLKVDGVQLIYTAYDQLQSDGDDALIIDHSTAVFYPANQSTGWQTTTIYSGDESSAGGILTDRITIDATATALNSSYRLYVNGEAFFDDPLVLDSVSAPSTATNKLYNISGTLYWNGNQIGVGAVNSVTNMVDNRVLTASGTNSINGEANLTFDGSTLIVSGDQEITGNLTVQGTTTTIDTTNLDVKDKNITLNYGTGDTSANADGAGITIQDAVSSTTDATILWTTANDTFNFSHPVSVTGNITSSNTVISQSINVSSSGYGTIEVGGVTGAYIDLKRPNTDDYDLRLITDGTGGVIDTGSGELTLKRQGSTKIATTSSGINVTGTITSSDSLTITGDTKQVKFTGTTGPFGFEFGDTENNPNFRIYYRTTPNTLTFENYSESAQHTFDLSGNYTNTGDITVGDELIMAGGETKSINFVGTGTDTNPRRFAYESSGHHHVTNRHTDGDLILMSNNGTGGGETTRITLQSGSGTQDIDITNANLDLNSNNIKGVGTLGIGTDSPSGNLEIATSASDTGVDLVLDGNRTSNGGIGSIIFNNNGDSVGMIRSHRASANDAAHMLFYTQATGGGNTERMRIDSSGNVIVGGDTAQQTSAVTLTAGGSIINDGFIRPATDASYDIGSSSKRYQDLYLSGNITTGTISSGAIYTTGNLTAANGVLRVGLADTTSGAIDVYGGSAGVEGGEIRLHLTNGYDTTYQWYRIDAYQDDFRIGRQGNTDFYIFQDGKVKVENNFEVGGTISSGAITASGLTVDTSTLVVDATNNRVGIGTTSPYTLLELSSTDPIIRMTDSDGVADKSIYEMRAIGASGYESLEFRSVNDANSVYNKLLVLKHGGNVGIGTDAPAAPLEVIGTDPNNNVSRVVNIKDDRSYAADVGGGISFFGKYNSGGSYSTFAHIIGAKTNATDGDYSGYLAFKTRSASSLPTERMRINSSGNVGINTTHPDSKLDVTGGDITVNTTGTGFMHFKYNNGSTGTIGTDGIDLKITANADLQILPTGNVGIGETSPLGKLHVKTADSGASVNVSGNQLVIENSGSAGLSILSGTTGDGNIFLGDSGNNVAGVLQYSHNGDSFRISSTGQLLLQTGGANTRLAIDSFGNAIFTKSGGAYLQLKDASAVRGAINVETSDGLVFTTGSSFTERMRISSTGAVSITADASNEQLTIKRASNTNEQLIFGFHSDDYGWIQSVEQGVAYRPLVLNRDGGNVGINTTNPSRKISVFSDTDGYTAELSQTGAYNSGKQSGIVFSAKYDTAGNVTDLASIRGGKENTTNNNWAGNLRFYTRTHNGSDTERMRIDSSGNLLVSKTSSDLTTDGIELRDTGGIVAIRTNGDPLYLNRKSTDGAIATFAKDGTTVGSIGVVASNNLYIHGDTIGLGIGDDNLYPTNSSGGANGNAVDIGDSTVKFRNLYLSSKTRYQASGGNQHSVGVDVNDLIIRSETAGSETARFTYGGNVGIGTDSPNEILHVHKSTTPRILLTDATTGTTSGSDGMFLGIAGDQGLNIWNYENTYTRFAVNNDEKMRITSSGNVGIGITDPDQALEIGAGGKLKLSRADNARSLLLFTDNNNATIQSDTDPLLIQSADRLTFNTNGANERLRIDSSGNLLVAQSSTTTPGTGNTTTGISLRDVGAIHASRDGNRSLYVNRNTTDGQIISVQKDGVEIGSIGTRINDITIGTGDTGLRFSDGGDSILPAQSGASGDRDAAIDLGATGARFKDLHLSGKAYLDTSSGAKLVLQTDATRGFIGTSTSHALILETAATERMRIDSSGNAIFTKSGGAYLQLKDATAVRGAINVETSDGLVFTTGSSFAERMRIDSSGNLLVGQTSASSGAVGVSLRANGRIFSCADGDYAAHFNRNTSDGVIAHFAKDDNVVGNIGNNTDFYIASQDGTGLRFTNNQILPCSESGAIQNTSRDLGSSTGKFRDLYLAGDVIADGDISTNELVVDTIATIDGALSSGAATINGIITSQGDAAVNDAQIGRLNFKNTNINASANPIRASIFGGRENSAWGGYLSFYTSTGTSAVSEKARITSNGNLLIGKNTADNTNTGIRIDGGNDFVSIVRAGNPCLILNRTVSDGVIMQIRKDGTTKGQIGMTDSVASSSVYFSSGSSSSTGTGLKFVSAAGTTNIIPCRGDGTAYDNAVDLGSSGTRFDDIYATNGTIQTSDRNEKQDIQELSEAEQRVAVACKGLIRRYKFNSAVAEKGDEARYHFGIIAQDLQDAFTAEGLDAGDYGMFISETWTDEEGNEQTKLGVRYNELLAFIIATL